MRQIFLDTETTGLSPENGDRVIEIACVELFNRKLTGNNRHYYVNPGRDSHEEALKVHGITTEFLKDKPPFAAVADELMRYLDGADVFIHNAPFDLGFLDNELALLGRPGVRSTVAKVVDTLALALEAARTEQADLAFVTLAQVLHRGRVAAGSVWVVPPAHYPAIRYEGALLKSGTQKEAAQALVQLLQSAEGQRRINRFGFGP